MKDERTEAETYDSIGSANYRNVHLDSRQGSHRFGPVGLGWFSWVFLWCHSDSSPINGGKEVSSGAISAQ